MSTANRNRQPFSFWFVDSGEFLPHQVTNCSLCRPRLKTKNLNLISNVLLVLETCLEIFYFTFITAVPDRISKLFIVEVEAVGNTWGDVSWRVVVVVGTVAASLSHTHAGGLCLHVSLSSLSADLVSRHQWLWQNWCSFVRLWVIFTKSRCVCHGCEVSITVF